MCQSSKEKCNQEIHTWLGDGTRPGVNQQLLHDLKLKTLQNTKWENNLLWDTITAQDAQMVELQCELEYHEENLELWRSLHHPTPPVSRTGRRWKY
jgi:hypothetical protein